MQNVLESKGLGVFFDVGEQPLHINKKEGNKEGNCFR
jgi:hypothetical protein